MDASLVLFWRKEFAYATRSWPSYLHRIPSDPPLYRSPPAFPFVLNAGLVGITAGEKEVGAERSSAQRFGADLQCLDRSLVVFCFRKPLEVVSSLKVLFDYSVDATSRISDLNTVCMEQPGHYKKLTNVGSIPWALC